MAGHYTVERGKQRRVTSRHIQSTSMPCLLRFEQCRCTVSLMLSPRLLPRKAKSAAAAQLRAIEARKAAEEKARGEGPLKVDISH